MAGRRVDLAGVESSELRGIVDRATSGDRSAAAVLVHGLAPVVRRRIASTMARWPHARRIGHDVDDLVQETFARLFRDRGRALRAWDPGRGLGLPGFVALIAEREVGLMVRSRKRKLCAEPVPHDALSTHIGDTSLAGHIEARDQLHRLFARACERLTASGRCYFQWLVVEARAARAVARDTGTSLDAVYAWRSRLTRLLREIHGELERPPGRAPHRHAESARWSC